MTATASGPAELLHRLRARAGNAGQSPITHVERVPARTGRPAPWPSWTHPEVREAFARQGITAPWQHQADAAGLAFEGTHVVLATGTASGKSLAYQLPALTALTTDPKATVLYLAPTKALAADQLRKLTRLGLADIRPAALDGDVPREEREWIRQHARFLLTNPDMLHHSLLPGHSRWATFFRRLTYVVIDECHAYRGVFGSHVAHVLRRLRRTTARYGGSPTFILASATSGDPAGSTSRLLGTPVTAVTEDASPRGAVTFALWEPPLLPPEPATPTFVPPPTIPVPAQPTAPAVAPARPTAAARHTDSSRPTAAARPTDSSRLAAAARPTEPLTPAALSPLAVPPPEADFDELDLPPVRRSALRETADLLTDAVIAGTRTLAFVRSRRGAEVVAAVARRSLDEVVPGLGSRVAAYRGGYLREDRRAIERALLAGDLLGLASTNALELGVDLAGLDAVLICGWPGTRASLWQQAGRAGRAGGAALAVLIARDDPLDTYLVHHPEALFGHPVEATVLDPANPYVLGPQLCCAASEAPLTEKDLPLFGPATRPVIDQLVAEGALRRRPSGWYWTERGRPDVDLRGSGGAPVQVVEAATGRLLGTVDQGSSHVMLHEGAVHLHQGTTYVVDELDLEDATALVHQEDPDWSTHARDVTDVSVVRVFSYADAGPVGLFLGEVDVTSQVVSYQRRRLGSGEVIDIRPLDLPVRELRTVAVWFTVSPQALAAAGIEPNDVPGALHAAEHAAIGLLPLMATCDRWDIGGLSTANHPDTEAPTVFVYDGHPGGAGFAERAHATAAAWLTATREAIAACACDSGCPSCVQSPKCGNGNNPLSKPGALKVLDTVLAALPETP
ncbi:DEAD/DEAH box helicase [Actinoplanes sp. SE50]|uniref:DEAD/DEAH box helicase n=1 Tax=unclassified Actinoplanes TaxID=2626549 RepID=UPI00023EC3C2|nr:Putative ATP-dependent helicase HRQ1 [Actinoplanes sp. SE50/110]ATO79784.1 DEAD/DEAH box helicase [Actinoplanes sp. SE50]SLL97186.1 ATP-dependent helicase [Actinoplanes sp. SE50/110]